MKAQIYEILSFMKSFLHKKMKNERIFINIRLKITLKRFE